MLCVFFVCRSHHSSVPGSLDWTVSDRYLALDTKQTLATYIWIDGTGQVNSNYDNTFSVANRICSLGEEGLSLFSHVMTC